MDPFFDRGGIDKGLFWHISASLQRVALGYRACGARRHRSRHAGRPVGWAMRGLDPIFQVLRTVPPLAWLPLSLAAFREAQPSAIFVIFITAIWPIIINTAVGVRNIPQDYRNVAAVLRLTRLEFFAKIMLPAAAPYIFTGLRIGIGLSWLAIVAAEMLIGGVGIGFFIWDAWNTSRITDIIVALTYVGLIGFVLDRVVALVGRFRDPRHERAMRRPAWNGLSPDRPCRHLVFARRRHAEVLRDVDLQDRARRIRLDHRPFGLRQVDPAQRRRRPAAASLGGVLLEGREVERARPRPRGGVPEPLPAALADRATRTSGSPSTRCSAHEDRAPSGANGSMYNLGLVRMNAAADKRPNEISGGMKQRVGIARALAMEPKVLLLDEPFGALDALTRAHLQDQVMEIHARLGNTVLMITHDVDEAVLLSDRIVMMTNGPEATIGEILKVGLPRPRKRLDLVDDHTYNHARAAVLEFLYARHAAPALAA